MKEEAERHLRDAQARVNDAATAIAAGDGNSEELHAAQLAVLAAERGVARLAGDEYAEELDFELSWDVGAPMPRLLTNGHRTFVMFDLANPDPDWDGTWVQIADPGAADAIPLGIVQFHRVHSIKLGGPNDEAIAGHPLSGKGLRPYAAHQVVNSRWIAAEERINSAHPQHRGGWHERLTHYVFCFHDETLECLARGLTTERCMGSPRAVLAELAGRLLV